MKEKILALLRENKFLSLDEILEKIDGNKEDIENELKSLEEEYIIYKSKKERYGLLSSFNYYLGTISLKKQGYGFFKCDDLDEDIFIPAVSLDNALDNDTVIVWINPSYEGSKEGQVVKTVKHNNELICKIEKKFFNFDNKVLVCDTYPDVRIETDDFKEASFGDVVSCKVVSVDLIKKNVIKVEIEKIIGNINDIGIDIKALAYKYGLDDKFSESIYDNLKEVDEKYLSEIELNKKRRKYVDKNIITIDGADAKDLDDAVTVEKIDDNTYLLGVYIADVSYFVKEGSEIDKEALNRGTSVYLLNKVIPMLPPKLSNELCSLNEKTDKYVIALEAKIDKYGNVLDSDIFEAIINTKHRMTYDDVEVIIDYLKSSDKDSFERMDIINKYQDIIALVQNMKDLSFILSNMKKKRGALDFDIPEADIKLDDNGKVIDVKERKVLKSHKLIEDFMVCANEIVAETVKDMDLPFIYRVHDKPEEYKMERLEKLLKAVKINFKKKSKSLNAYFLQDVLKNLKDDDKALKANILRMMAKAEYSSLNIGHFGLASKCYTHFTSPIRRYPDLLVHRLIRKYIINSEKFYATYNKEEEEKLNSKIREIATISTDREINANMCEFEAIDMKKAEYMESHVGDVYDAVITSVLSSGFFVSLDNTIEGMVHIRSLKSDRFYYDAGSSALVGKNNGKAYMQGMKVKVICTYANKEDREVGFILYSDSKQTKSVLKYKKKH